MRLVQRMGGEIFLNLNMPFHRNFTYWIDKRKWKYYFLMVSLELVRK